jgi:hypothetical protein
VPPLDEDVKKVKVDRWGKVRKWILLIVLILIVTLPLGFLWTVSVNCHTVLRKAKNVRISLILEGIEFDAKGGALYDPTKTDGFCEGGLDAVRETSTMDGEIRLTGWNDSDNSPHSFTYREGNYYAEFTGTSRTESSWNVYFDWNVLHYDGTDIAE